ncbi:UNVERIFIED_CONTAM: hypothetical protein FKN15_028205 [Acipenser sinensis]
MEEEEWCTYCHRFRHEEESCPAVDRDTDEERDEPEVPLCPAPRRGRGKLQQYLQQQQEEVRDDGWEVYVINLVAELCPGCGAYGHTLAICPTQYEEGECEHPAPRRGEREHPPPRRGEPVHPAPRRGEPIGPEPRPPGAEQRELPLPPPAPSLPPPGAEQRELPLSPPPPLLPPPGAEQLRQSIVLFLVLPGP